ncbi:MAG: hypothetical protein CUN56_14260, partial [Phototrophicales bacterium]
TTGSQPLPQKVINLSDVIDLSVANTSACALRSDGTIWCWGRDNVGQLGNGSILTANQNAPTLVDVITNAVDISCYGQNCLASVKTPKQAPSTAPTAPVIIEQPTTVGNTMDSYGLGVNYNTTGASSTASIAWTIDAQDTNTTNSLSAGIRGKGSSTTPSGLRFIVNDGSSPKSRIRISNNGAASLVPSTGGGAIQSPKLNINNSNLTPWNDARFDDGFLISDFVGLNQPAFYGLDSTNGKATILSGQDLLIQHSSTNGTTLTPVLLFDKVNAPRFYGDIIMGKRNGHADVTAYTDTADETAALEFFRYRGTEGAPAAIALGDHFGEISFKGFDGTNYNANGATRLSAISTITSPIAGQVPNKLGIFKEDGTASGQEILRIGNGGNLIIKNASSVLNTGNVKTDGRTTADEAIKAGNDLTCSSTDDDGIIRFTGTHYEYCEFTGGANDGWHSLVSDPVCKDDAKIVDISIVYKKTCAIFDNGQLACWG